MGPDTQNRIHYQMGLPSLMNPEERREFYKQLRERIKQLRMQHLFEEPCPLYEPEEEDDS